MRLLPGSWGLECFQLITEREVYSSAQNITWWERGEAGVCKVTQSTFLYVPLQKQWDLNRVSEISTVL